MTPSSVRKLRNLCARSESSASRSVSPMVIAALRKRLNLAVGLTGPPATRGIALTPSMGVTPNQTSNFPLVKTKMTSPSFLNI